MVKIKYMEDIMFETLTIDVTNVKKILKCCPYYDDIINSDIMYNDDLSIDLIEWYKDIIFHGFPFFPTGRQPKGREVPAFGNLPENCVKTDRGCDRPHQCRCGKPQGLCPDRAWS